MKTMLLSGYYGFQNTGDEAVLGGILTGLRDALPEVAPVVLSADPAQTERQYGVTALPRMHLSAIRAQLARTDLFLSGGGSLLQDVTSPQSPFYYLGLLWLAQRAAVPTMVLAQGLGPLRRLPARLLARKVLNRTRAITVRDEASALFLEELGVTQPPVEVTADPSFLLQAQHSERLTAWWEQYIPANRPVIGVALRRWRSPGAPERYHAISEALVALAQHTGALVLFLPMQPEQDEHVAEEMAGWTPAESRVLTIALTPPEMLAAIGRCDFILAMRLHALIFAVKQATPAFGLAYDPKVRDFSLAAGLPLPIDWAQITTPDLTETLQQQWDARQALRERLVASARELTTRAWRNITRVQDVLAMG